MTPPLRTADRPNSIAVAFLGLLMLLSQSGASFQGPTRLFFLFGVVTCLAMVSLFFLGWGRSTSLLRARAPDVARAAPPSAPDLYTPSSAATKHVMVRSADGRAMVRQPVVQGRPLARRP
jgi:hypothetical protein